MDVKLKVSKQARIPIAISGFVLILLGFIVQVLPNKKETKTESIKLNSSTQTYNPSSNNSSATQLSQENSNQHNSSSQYGPEPASKTTETKQEDYSSYVNSSIANSSGNDVSVTIVDENGNISSSLSNSIADIYNKTGNRATTGLLRSSFVHKSEFQELTEGNSDIITKLNLSHYTDYLVIGKINFSFHSGTLESGTIVCTASISLSIINTASQSIVKNVSISDINGNGVTESQAKETTMKKLLNNFYSSYSTL
ncbi:MAG: hypothetical protein IPO49_09915 [Bacteroidetes bacterium]|nr:hypothetical protein [Bacteroidota bacterium]